MRPQWASLHMCVVLGCGDIAYNMPVRQRTEDMRCAQAPVKWIFPFAGGYVQGRDRLRCLKIYLHCWVTAVCSNLAENTKLMVNIATLYCFWLKALLVTKERKTLVGCFTSYRFILKKQTCSQMLKNKPNLLNVVFKGWEIFWSNDVSEFYIVHSL